MMDEKSYLQESEYSFPYHYLPHIDPDGTPRITRGLGWGIDYITYMQVIMDEIRAILPAGGSLLDIGCGDGYLLNNLGLFGLEKHGIDLSERAIGFAKAFATDSVFEVCDIRNLNHEYDVVTCIEVLEHIPDDLIADFVAQMVDCMRPKGYLVISVPTTVVKVIKKHYRHYDEVLLSAHLEANHPLFILREMRVYRESRMLSVFRKALNNKIWTINAALILRLFWRWHCNKNIIASQRDGAHLIRVYRKC